jgi:hypothetical protein
MSHILVRELRTLLFFVAKFVIGLDAGKKFADKAEFQGRNQRVFNVLYRARLSLCRMIWLLPTHPFARQQVVFLSQSSCASLVKLFQRGRGWGLGRS